MLQVGKFNKLKVVKTVDFGVYLDGGEKGEILLPRKFVPEQSCSEGGEIDVFVYYDSEDRLIATTQKPYAQVGEFAWLQVKSVNRIGAFLDWGVEAKDLLVPFREQNTDMQQGEFYIVYVYLVVINHPPMQIINNNLVSERSPLSYYDFDRLIRLIFRRDIV